MPDSPLLIDIDNGISLITLNRPTKFNALSYGLIDDLLTKLDIFERDAAIGAVILTGAASPPAQISPNSRRVYDRAAMRPCAISCNAASA